MSENNKDFSRILRSLQEPYGMRDLGYKQWTQCNVGTKLFLFALQLGFDLALHEGFSTFEHPQAWQGKASSWETIEMQHLICQPNIQTFNVDYCQLRTPYNKNNHNP